MRNYCADIIKTILIIVIGSAVLNSCDYHGCQRNMVSDNGDVERSIIDGNIRRYANMKYDSIGGELLEVIIVDHPKYGLINNLCDSNDYDLKRAWMRWFLYLKIKEMYDVRNATDMSGNKGSQWTARCNDELSEYERQYYILSKRTAQQVDSAEASTIAVPPSEPSGSPR